MAKIEVELKDYVNAKDGSLLIKRNGKWEVTTFEELNKDSKKLENKLNVLENDLESMKRYSKHFVVYAKSHFLVAFNYFKIKVLSGDLDVVDEEVLRLDEAVLNNEISVEDALDKNDFLKHVYNQLYLDGEEMKEFPEV